MIPPIPKSAAPGIVWPAIVAPDVALLLALQYQFERSEWLAADAIEHLQMRQVACLLAHAHAESPFWTERLDAAGYRADIALTTERFRSIPILRRRDLQTAGDRMHARTVPREHGSIGADATSGSTAEPIHFRTTNLAQLVWHALTLREHLWHGRDFGARLAAIRSVLAPGDQPNWGLPADLVFDTGAAYGLRVSEPVAMQADWLIARDPEYLITYPSNLMLLAREFVARGARLPRLREVRTFGERLPAGLRELCRQAWDVPLVDVYSAQEVGYIALQCPRHPHYHVQSENVLVEVLDEHDLPCAIGQPGRVVVTSLNNFATPFIRYDLGDYAEFGPACECGRGLPVLHGILGRVRNMARLADGGHFWPRIRASEWFEIADIREFRLVQIALDTMRLEVVTPQPLAAAATAELSEHVRARLGHPYTVVVERMPRIERGAAHKFDDFVCALEG